MRQFSRHRGFTLLARQGLVLGLCICGAHALAQPAEEPFAAKLEGQRRFLESSLALCAERVPALKAQLADARAHAERKIREAEVFIGKQVAAGAIYRPLLERYTALWNTNAAALLESLKKQKAESACATLRDSWLAIEADVIVEDWQKFLQQNLADDDAGARVHEEGT